MQIAYRVLYYPLQLLLRLGIIYVLFSLCRIVFYLVNLDSFPALSGLEFASLLLAGLRFDTSAIIYVNALFILSYVLPFSFRQKQWYKNGQLFLFLGFNFLALLLELIDVGFYHFAFKRSVGSDIQMIINSAQLTPQYIFEYWYLTLVLLFSLWGMYFLYKKTALKAPSINPPFWKQVLVFLVAIPIGIMAARGGLQLRPIMPITATDYVEDMRLAPLVSNTTLSIIFSAQQKSLAIPNYFPADELKKHHSGWHSKDSLPMSDKNIVILVVESFGKEQVGYFNPGKKSFTPFFDSLARQSWMAQESFANGLRSTQGIVAISAGIPSLMEDPLMFSAYQSNQVSGLAGHLKKKGYTTGFFHGSNPGSMEFEKFAKLSGFEHFYDRTAYPDQADYDGNWGIWDAPFLDFFATTINEYPKPFFAHFFSLTSHHPYAVEADFAKRYPDLDIVDRSYLYTDNALRKFFQKASQMPWFEETLFIITADHVAPPKTQSANTKHGRYKIPILFYDPSHAFSAPDQNLVQQVDILPSVLDYLHYDEPYSSFGQSIFDTLETRYAYMYAEGFYQILDHQYLLLFDGKSSSGLFDYQADQFLEKNLIGKEKMVLDRMENKIKALIQRHHFGMVNNRLEWVE